MNILPTQEKHALSANVHQIGHLGGWRRNVGDGYWWWCIYMPELLQRHSGIAEKCITQKLPLIKTSETFKDSNSVGHMEWYFDANVNDTKTLEPIFTISLKHTPFRVPSDMTLPFEEYILGKQIKMYSKMCTLTQHSSGRTFQLQCTRKKLVQWMMRNTSPS